MRVAFEDRPSLAAAVGLAAGLGLAGAATDDKDLSLTAPSDDPVRTIRDVLALADAHGLAVAGVSVVKPTLDDVFLALTSKEPAR